MKALRLAVFAAVLSMTVCAAQADPMADLEYVGHSGETAVLRFSLEDPNDPNVAAIRSGTIRGVWINDLNTQAGSGEIFSGFDLDFILFDRDGDIGTTGDQILPLGDPWTFVTPGNARQYPGGPYAPPYPGRFFGLNADDSINEAAATLGAADAYFDFSDLDHMLERSGGWVSLGDAGIINVAFPLISLDEEESMYLLIGEAGTPGVGQPPDELAEAFVEIELAVGAGFDYYPGRQLAPGDWVNLDANPEGPQGLQFRWDFDGDGEYDDAVGPYLSVNFSDLFLLYDWNLFELREILVLATLGDEPQGDPISFELELVPEPATLGLFAVALPFALRRRRRKNA